MPRKADKSDFTEVQWQLLDTLIPAENPGGKHRSVDMRAVVKE